MVTFFSLCILITLCVNLLKVTVSLNTDLFDKNVLSTDSAGGMNSINQIGKIENNNKFNRNDLILINKCCPFDNYFDVNTLICKKLSFSKILNYQIDKEMNNLEEKFIKSHIRNNKNLKNYKFSFGVPQCGDSKVLISQVTTNFSCDIDGAKVEGVTITDKYCIDDRDGEGTVLLTCHDGRNTCRYRPCIRKCKPYGQFFGMEEEDSHKPPPPLSAEFYNLKTLKLDNIIKLSDFGIYFGDNCGGRGRQMLDPETEPADVHYLGTDGRLLTPEPERIFYTHEEYCIEYVKTENISEVYSFLCFPEASSDLLYYVIATFLIISCVTLLATFLVYLFSPNSRNLYGKSLMCYVASLFCAYLSLAIIQLHIAELGEDFCIWGGYSMLFFFLAAFSWLNVMSYDIWKTFRSVRSTRFNNSSKGKIQFLWYSLYAWTIPFVLTGFCVAADRIPNLVHPSIKPGFGDQTCWFSRFTNSIYLFFITPISLIIVCNTILFVNTAWRCWKIKSEIIRMGNQSRKKYTANKTQFIVNGKLFIVMGVVWSLEVLSFFFDHPIWYISDAANALHGVFIFVIFVLKKKILSGLPQRIKKPFIRMKNMGTKSKEYGNDSKDLDDTVNTSKRHFSRSSSTYVTDVSI